ncbi:MAG: hypothetical protein IKM51_04940 [Oscillospiraceae bacterium]|nr:hypothetical protein [Oscillospiraceae bacterium]
MKKTVIIINGKGGSGKDAFCDAAELTWKVRNRSSITPIKELALKIGWNGEKDEKGRLLLVRLKEAMTDYCDLPQNYLLKEYEEFMQSDEEIMFAHIREKDQIDRFAAAIPTNCYTLLIHRPSLDSVVLGNSSDDLAESFEYDLRFENSGTFEELPNAVKDFLLPVLEA